MRIILICLAAFGAPAFADPVLEACQRDVPKDIARSAQKKKPGLSEKQANDFMKGGMPAAEYELQKGIAICAAEKMKPIIMNSSFESVCPSVKTKFRVDCFRSWANQQTISYGQQVAEMAISAVELAKSDDMKTLDTRGVSVILLDTLLSAVERYSTAKNVAYQARIMGARAQMPLRAKERRDFSAAKAQVVRIVSGELANLKKAKSPQPALEARLAKVRQK